jgi:hypothetical protein
MYTYFVGPIIAVAWVRELILMEELDKKKRRKGQGKLEIGEKDYEEGVDWERRKRERGEKKGV